MRTAALAGVVIAALAAGCGGDSADAEETVTAAISGLATGDEQKVCAQLTRGAEKKLLAVLADNPFGFRDIEARSCEEAITKVHAQLTPAQRAVLEDGEVDEARLNGERATVHVTGAGMDVELEKIADAWKITGGLFTVGPRPAG